MRIARLRSDDQSQETCPDDIAAFERPRKGVQAAGSFSFPEKVPSPACRFRVAEEVAGFCIFKFMISAIAGSAPRVRDNENFRRPRHHIFPGDAHEILTRARERIDTTGELHHEGRVYAVEANSYFARPGPRVVDGTELLAHLIHPGLFP